MLETESVLMEIGSLVFKYPQHIKRPFALLYVIHVFIGL